MDNYDEHQSSIGMMGEGSPDELLKVTQKDLGDGLYMVSAEGSLDLASEHRLRLQTAELITNGHIHIILDLAGIRYIDSTGLVAVVGTLRRVRERNGSLGIVVQKKSVMRVFELTGINQLIEISATTDEAIANARRAING